MKIKASGRVALMIATGLFVCFAGPLPASAAGSDTTASKSDGATDGKSVDQNSRQGKRDAHRKSPESTKAAVKDAGKDNANKKPSAAIPASVANANAQLTSADAAAGGTAAMSADAASDGNVVAADQLNDLDRAVQETQSAEQQASQTPAAEQQTVAMVLASGDSTSLDRTSLIGKIFIGFGALLTVASAARMLMA
ncbi:hypothetical protein [Bradyrhizobium lablabi]|uniref:hypothetical protein n=1 Tax=Bradyrhizobium lablabi TaxID=722472 RepID=UPI001BA6B4C1|nr:hypothetical protein [Bradyrhizobium lablabi]MBR0694664.1 hypothetical protein [Bradyrhizobium lablabi]